MPVGLFGAVSALLVLVGGTAAAGNAGCRVENFLSRRNHE